MNYLKKEISRENYEYLKSYIGASKEEDIINAHKELIGKTCKDEYFEIKDCGMEFILELLSIDWGRSFAYEYSIGAKNFMQSKYLSNYIKYELKKMLGNMNYYAKNNNYYNETMKKLLNSNKSFNEMNENEIKYLFSYLKFSMSNKESIKNVDTKIVECFNLLLYKLDGKGVVSLLKDDNYITKRRLANQILITSGLNDRASFYSGRGVNYGDLSDKNLTEIFRKLYKIDINYAINFINMVLDMKTLGATEFINSFKEFAVNNFNLENYIPNPNNFSLDEVYDNNRNVVAFASLISSYGKENEINEIHQSNRMKRAFLVNIKTIIKEINPKLYEKIEKTYIYGKRW